MAKPRSCDPSAGPVVVPAAVPAEDRTDRLYIRCDGIHDQIKLYSVFGTDFSQNTTGSTTKRCSKVIYKIIVKEPTEEVTVVEPDTEEVVVHSSGGLFQPNGRISILGGVGGQVVAVIDEQRLVTTTPVGYQREVHWGWNFNAIDPRDPKQTIMIHNQLTSYNLVQIWGIRHSAVVAAKILYSELKADKEKKLMIILAALKMYYSVLKYHAFPVPNGILCMMPKGTPSPPDLSILESMSRVRIRLSCVDKNMHFFADVLSEDSLKILMVVANRRYRDQNYFFRDIYGIVQFTTCLSSNKDIFDVQLGNGTPVGTINHQSGAITATNETDFYMMFAKANPRPSQLAQTKVGQINMHRRGTNYCAAEVYRERETGDIALCMLNTLNVSTKALILGRAITAAHLIFRFYDDHLLAMRPDYPYREQ